VGGVCRVALYRVWVCGYLVGLPDALVAFAVAGVEHAVALLLAVDPLAHVGLPAGQDQRALAVELLQQNMLVRT
jgi:hypothetical protein